MKKRLERIAKYLGNNGLYKEAYEIKKIAQTTAPYTDVPPQTGAPYTDEPPSSGVSGATGGRGWVYDNDWNISAEDLFNHAPKILAYIKSTLNQNQGSYDFVVDDGKLFIQANNNLSGYEEIPRDKVLSNPDEAWWIVQQGANMGFIEAKYYLNSISMSNQIPAATVNPAGYALPATPGPNARARDPLTGLPPLEGNAALSPVPGRYGVAQDREGNLFEYQDPPNYPTWKEIK